jgi:hypothetical protein
MRLTAEGYSSRQIGLMMGRSTRTVDRYRSIGNGTRKHDKKAEAALVQLGKNITHADWDEYRWKRCRTCKAQVLDGWAHLHDEDCPNHHDDRRDHPTPTP